MPCVFARVSGVPTPSSDLSKLGDFIDLRDSVRERRIGRGGREVSEALSEGLDLALRDLASPLPERVSLVALGGYGRRELSPFSDVDLMLLHDIDDPAPIAADVFRPLWDAKLRLGHSVRTLRESAGAAKERFDTQTTLLTSRLVAGDSDLFESLMGEVTSVTRARPLRRYLVAEERQRRRDTPFLLMEADVKKGRGGLRTLQGFEWERRREALIGRFSPEGGSGEAEARESLLRIRNALHATAGRSHDVFSLDLREPVARWLGVEVFDAATMLVGGMRAVDDLATKRWPEVTEETPSMGTRVWSRIVGSRPRASRDGPSSFDGLVEMLVAGESGRVAFERLWEAGRLDEILPEWGVVRGLPQLAPFHEHPVDDHLWRTVSEMHSVVRGGGDYQEVAEKVDDPGLLLLAAFLHDIGKGHGGRHEEIGAEITATFCRRVGIDGERAQLLEQSVRHHLLLAQTATRRDLDDAGVIDEIAGTVGSLRQLQILYLLTVADSMATGPTIWTEWKATLVRTLFNRCSLRFDERRPGALEPATSIEEIISVSGDGRSEEVREHVGELPDDYLRSTSAEDVLWHLDLISSLSGMTQLAVRPGTPVETAVVIGQNTPSFRRQVAESFAANGIDVLEARMHTRSDGLIVDSFQVRDDRTGGVVSPQRWDTARHDIEAATRGELDTIGKVVARASAYGSDQGGEREPRVDCSVDPATGDLVVVVKCSERIGRLAEILAALGDAGLEVRLAKLDSRGDELIDTFHVRGGVSHPGSVRDLEQIIAAGITS